MLIITVAFASLILGSPPTLTISNDDLSWSLGSLGLQPSMRGSTAQILKGKIPYDPDTLVTLLEDPNRFAAAHFLLVELEGASGEISSDSWFGLTINLDDEGNPAYDKRERKQLRKTWEKHFQRKKMSK